jgi:small subunit ribosomal protein S17
MKTENKVEKTEKGIQTECTDKNCPIHGSLSVRGRDFVGTVVSDRMAKTVVVSWERRVYVPKYERYEVKYSKVKAHAPECMKIKKDDKVKINECRPLSKTKNFVVVEKVN